MTRLLVSLLKPEMVFFDVGANIGYFSLIAAQRCREVHAFEPVPDIYVQLELNVSLNPQSSIATNKTALSNISGISEFFVVEDGENTGLSSLVETTQAHKINVNSVTLDAYCTSTHVRPNVIKIDVEGAEERVLKGAAELLNGADPPDIIFECHAGASTDCLLKRYGYSIFSIRGQREYEARNLFASKRELSNEVRTVLC